MLARLSFIPAMFFLFTGIAWWGQQFQFSLPAEASHPQTATQVSESQEDSRRELLDYLERAVAHEHYYRSAYGFFTRILSRTGLQVPTEVRESYQVQVVHADSHRLLIYAVSEIQGKQADEIWVDQDFRVQSNFSLPEPNSQKLQDQARKHLQLLLGEAARSAPTRFSAYSQAWNLVGREESAIYRGYFRYELQADTKNRLVARAVGVKAPVQGLELEAQPDISQVAHSELGESEAMSMILGGPTLFEMTAQRKPADAAKKLALDLEPISKLAIPNSDPAQPLEIEPILPDSNRIE